MLTDKEIKTIVHKHAEAALDAIFAELDFYPAKVSFLVVWSREHDQVVISSAVSYHNGQ